MPEGTVDHPPGSALIPVATPAGLEASPTIEALGLEEHGLSQRALVWRRFRRHKLAMASLVTRLLYGGRVSLLVGLGVALVSAVVGTLAGAAAGYYGGRLDNFVMRLTDLFLSIPLLVLLIIASKATGGHILDIVLVVSLALWMFLARIVRGLFLSLREKEFVEAARAIGSSNARIIFRHMLPNALGVIIVNVTLTVAIAILTESLLSFLGFGIQPPTPTWGNMLEDGRSLMTIAGWLVWFPGLAILVTVLCVNFLGDGLRDALDPTQRRVRA